MGTDLFAWVPRRCPEGHYLRDEFGETIGGAAAMGSESCLCPAAQAGGPPYMHLYVICTACLNDGSDGMLTDPPCQLPGSEQRP